MNSESSRRRIAVKEEDLDELYLLVQYLEAGCTIIHLMPSSVTVTDSGWPGCRSNRVCDESSH